MDLCLWLFPSFQLARFPPSTCRYAVPLFVFSVCCPAHRSPHPLCFPPVIFLSSSFLCFPFLSHIVTTNPCTANLHTPLNSSPFSRSFLYSRHISPFPVMFSSSCYVAKLVHHPLLIENQDDSGGGSFLPFDVVLA